MTSNTVSYAPPGPAGPAPYNPNLITAGGYGGSSVSGAGDGSNFAGGGDSSWFNHGGSGSNMWGSSSTPSLYHGLTPDEEIQNFSWGQTFLWLFMMALTLGVTGYVWVFVFVELNNRKNAWEELYDALAAGEPGDPVGGYYGNEEVETGQEKLGIHSTSVSDIAHVTTGTRQQLDKDPKPPVAAPEQPKSGDMFIIYDQNMSAASLLSQLLGNAETADGRSARMGNPPEEAPALGEKELLRRFQQARGQEFSCDSKDNL
eukprot:CAMPEP_0179000150 /NCGR_PEP_ID=MMETSP0795-20121207/10494_1 /TAXON_ID=88552 /ORGANISM="Amoebophrya sp., Strain Ameob2" /LENGTH=258 /DNA_ID=CAMNT_0020693079 /DNA_START=52 /DNA_END=829 /DNA_ORIENTATION=+